MNGYIQIRVIINGCIANSYQTTQKLNKSNMNDLQIFESNANIWFRSEYKYEYFGYPIRFVQLPTLIGL